MDTDDIARGIISGALTDQVRRRGGGVIVGALVVAAAALVVAFATSGSLRVVSILVLLVSLAAAMIVTAVRWVAIRTIRTIGEPRGFDDHRATIDRALDDADLPTGPIAAMKFAWRLRKGPGPEFDRLGTITSKLAAELGESDGD